MRLRRFRLVCLLGGGLAVAGLLIAEGGLRLLGYPASYSALFAFDDARGYRLASGGHAVPTSQGTYQITVDAEGLVDRAGPEGAGAEILILGDGTVAGFELPPRERLAARLFQLSGKSVTNLSVPGYGTVQEWLFLKDWLTRHAPPRQVVIVFNFANDYYDNVPAWEGSRVPGIGATGDPSENRFLSIPPENPRGLARMAREVIWNSRLYALWVAWRNRDLPLETLPEQQKWLFMTNPPPGAVIGETTLAYVAADIRRLSQEYGFSVRWLAWNDADLLARESALSYDIAYQRVRSWVSGAAPVCWIDLPELSAFTPDWEARWLSPGGRHASGAATALMAEKITFSLPEGACGPGKEE